MKIIFLTLIVLSFLHSNEIQRMEAIIDDISKLRTDYEECKFELLKNKKDTVNPEYEILTDKVKKLEKIVKKQDELLKLKENNVKYIFKKTSDENKFPKLMMKKEFQKESVNKNLIINFKASAFFLNKNSTIYDAIDGTEIDKWESGTSFTSNEKTKEWIKIGGYFIDRKWRKAKKEMWVKLANTSKKHVKDGK